MILAWQINSIAQHVKSRRKMPDLNELLEGRAKGRQSIGQQRSVLEMLSEHSGIPLRKAGTKGKRGPA